MLSVLSRISLIANLSPGYAKRCSLVIRSVRSIRLISVPSHNNMNVSNAYWGASKQICAKGLKIFFVIFGSREEV